MGQKSPSLERRVKDKVDIVHKMVIIVVIFVLLYMSEQINSFQ